MRALAPMCFFLGVAACARPDAVAPRMDRAPTASTAPPHAQTEGVRTPRTVPQGLITQGVRAATFASEPPPGGAPLCGKDERIELTFEHAPTYTEKVERDAIWNARVYVGNPATCTRKVTLPISFTPPRATTTRTVEFGAYIAPRGAFVELALDGPELDALGIVPGRWAITFGVVDETGKPVGRAVSGNPFRRGRDAVALVQAPALPARIGTGDDLVVPFAIENVGDTANRVTPLVVFTRPGETAGIEHYEPPQLVVPGQTAYTLRLGARAREAEGILPGAWLVTVTMFDAGGDRLNSFAGIPLAIGTIDVRMTRPELPTRVKASDPMRVTFRLDNRGDAREKITAVVAFTKPGTTRSAELTFTREIAPGAASFDAVIEPAQRREKAVERGVWLVTTTAFHSSGERIKSFTGHYLEIVD